jgi:hypothetical protein
MYYPASAPQPQAPTLTTVRTFQLSKPAGRIDQFAALPDGTFVVRDANFHDPATQALEVYGRDSRLVRKISAFGTEPQQFLRLRGMAVAANGNIWIADLSRLMQFGADGRLIGTTLIQKPGYQIKALALDEAHGYMYLAGCLPLKVFLDAGCQLVHQYKFNLNYAQIRHAHHA